MPTTNNKATEAGGQRVALTARLSLDAYDAVVQLQRRHRAKKGRALPMWRVIDAAIRDYAQSKGIKIGS